MPELQSFDGRLLCADQPDGNFCVYDQQTGEVLYSRMHQGPWPPDAAPELPPPQPLAPVPLPPEPLTAGGGGVIRVTDERDGDLLNRSYSYWSQCWVSDRDSSIYVFVGHADGWPRFFRLDQTTGAITRLGPMLSYSYAYQGTGEGWSWDADGWIYLCDGPLLRRVNPFTGEDLVVLDISADHPGCDLWQAHSSDDGQTHSATVRRIVDEGKYPHLGTVVSRRGQQEYYPAIGELDESIITSDGAFLLIQEGNDNRIITLETRETRWLRQDEGAVGHVDVGPGFVVGEDDAHGACVLWDLRQPLTPGRRRTLFLTWNMGYVSVRAGRCLHSGDTHLSLVNLDGSGVTPLVEHGGGAAYDERVKANLSPCGRVACWVSNLSDQMDAYLLPL